MLIKITIIIIIIKIIMIIIIIIIRDVQNVLATDEDCEDSYFEDEDEVAALESSA